MEGELTFNPNFNSKFIRKIVSLYDKLTFPAYDKIGGEGARTTKSSVFCVDDSNDLNKKGKEGVGVITDRYSESVSQSHLSNAAGDCHAESISRSYLSDFARNGFVMSLSRFLTQRPAKLLNSRGAVLIEFAVCMPILIILLFYINDLVRLKRYYSQTEFVAQQMANILQNIAKKRAAEGTVISSDDISHAASLAYLTIYPGTSMYSTVNGSIYHELTHVPFVTVYYVKGTSEGKAKCLWGKSITCTSNTTPPWTLYRNLTANQRWSNVTYCSSEVDDSSIYPTLKVEDGMSKVIIETTLYWGTAFADTKGKKFSNALQAFRCHFVTPKHLTGLYCHSVVIFSPNAGFPEVRPD